MRLLIFSLLFSGSCIAEDIYGPWRPNYTIQKDERDSSLNLKQAAFTIHVSWNYTETEIDEILYADNGDEGKSKLTKNRSYSFKSKPGKHVLEFSIGEHHHEIRTDSIELKPGHRIELSVHFKHSHYQMQVRKPVIYLYPTEPTDVELRVDPVGEMVFTYPKYEESWKFKANPNGKLNFHDKTYNYLFWESEQPVPEEKLDFTKGEIIHRGDLTGYLEMMLSTYGLTSQEQADFITYWVPQMQDANYLYIYLLFDDECDAFAELTIHPKPDQIGRIYMLWDKVEDNQDVKLELQDIPELNREGFTVIEWGGAEINFKGQPEL